MTSLADFASSIVNVTLTTPYGKMLTIALKVPSYHRYREILSSVPEPPVPMKINAERKQVPDRESLSYIAALQERATEQNYRVLVDALVGGGMAIDGANLAEQVQTFRASEPDAGIVNAAIAFVVESCVGVRRSADDTPFRRLPTASDESVSANGYHADEVALITG